MRLLDLDLDFFLNENAYCGGSDSGRLDSEYKPWSVSKVQHFLEDRCGLSPDSPVPGRTVKSHDEVIDFWRMLIESGRLRIPFEVIHIDAHPDLWIGSGLYISSELLHIDLGRELTALKKKHIHSGNYLTFAIAYGWVGALVWIPLLKQLKDLPKWDADARSGLRQLKSRKGENSYIPDVLLADGERGVAYKVLPWQKFRTSAKFDYITLSKSPNFTPPESDGLIIIIEKYLKQI